MDGAHCDKTKGLAWARAYASKGCRLASNMAPVEQGLDMLHKLADPDVLPIPIWTMELWNYETHGHILLSQGSENLKSERLS